MHNEHRTSSEGAYLELPVGIFFGHQHLSRIGFTLRVYLIENYVFGKLSRMSGCTEWEKENIFIEILLQTKSLFF